MAGRLTGEFVIKMMFNHGVFPELDKAYAFANDIEEINEGDILQGEVNGRADGMILGYDKGYAAGKMDSSEYERGYNAARKSFVHEIADRDDKIRDLEAVNNRLLIVHDRMMSLAVVAAEKIAEEYGARKIHAIKALREKSGLSLAECKEIMDHVYQR